MTEPFSIQYSVSENLQLLSFSGQLVINHIEKIVGHVKERLDYGKSVEILVEACENMDITFIQFLVALQKTWMQKGLEFSVRSTVKEDLVRLIENAGFINVLK